MELACIPIVEHATFAVVKWCVPKCCESASSQLRDLLIRLRCWAGCFPGVEYQLIDYVSVDSIENTKRSVYAALENKSVIGLWGMGGVGKTTLMRKINNEMGKKGNIFIIWVTVSHNPIEIIQYNIARRLCSIEQLEEFKNKDEIQVRASIISDRLKKFESLIIFDDVWKDLNFTEIGIDIDDENLRCKIVLTSRDQDICRRLGAEHMIKMYARLDETESWVFFAKYSDIYKNPNLLRIKHIAKEICRKCAGLPLAISVVAKTLRGETLESKWNSCLNFLNDDCPQRVPSYVVENMYRLLKFSYERLEEDDLKMGFLLCSVFAQGQEIQLRDFICYDIGADKCVRQDRGQRSLNTYRDIFINLKRKGLLQDVVEEKEDELLKKENSARMHDVIRDVAISIAQTEFEGFFKIEKFIKWNSSIQNLNSTDRLQNINEVQFLSFNGNNILESIHPDFFEGMENLLFLDLRGTSISIKEFTETCLQKLAKLRVLMFKTLHQNITVDITDFFLLQHLSVLCLQNVHITELNQEFSKKLRLRCIDFSNTMIDIIRPNFFSILRNTLEELNMQGSYNKWKAFNQEDGDYVAFEELKDLKNLHSLHIDIDDKTIFSHEYAPSLVIPPVEYFSIRYISAYDEQRVWSSNILFLPSVQLSNVAKWLQVLFEKTKKLYMCDFEIDNNSATQAISSVIEQDIVKLLCNLKSLVVGYLSKQKNLIQYNTQGDPILPKLGHLVLWRMVGIENIFVNTGTQTIIPAKSFERLGRIYIYECDRLKFIFPWNVAECVVYLEELEISFCSELENIIEKDDQGVSGSKARTLFPKLRNIKLFNLPNLENVWKQECDEKSEMEWHSLNYLHVYNCKKLNRLFMGENSAPALHSIDCSKEWFDKLLWEDQQTERRFNGVFLNSMI
ncbi:NB-ARC domain-containing disease resistance protein [Zostera marina]|uniref:NB-ARC domain-containing disease resistance protein n=1 Tax=Zostera marina TaxID=29655 RepID=A0A0K9NHE6_ZOSMR|nr:NB-ARC domain-containing disease resistance protein [Zostera marina]